MQEGSKLYGYSAASFIDIQDHHVEMGEFAAWSATDL